MKSMIPPNSEVGVEGMRLSQLTEDDVKAMSKEDIKTYFDMF